MGSPEADTGAPAAKDDCVFCAIARGKLPSHRICESDDLVAFLDIHPTRPGHTLIVPRAHYPFFQDLPRELGADILTLAQDLSGRLKRRFDAPRVGFAFVGFDVAHVHAHVMPLYSIQDLTSRQCFAEENLTFRPPPRADDRELSELAAALRIS